MNPAEQQPSDTLVYGRIDESFHQVAAAVVEEVLRRLGHTVDVVEGPHPEMYPQLATGEMDLFADAWLPGGHEVYWEQVKESAVEAAVLYEGCMFYWAVPAYIPEDLVSSLEDLAKPEVVERMTTLAVQGTTPGAGLTMRSETLIESYGLAKVGWSQEIGDLQAIIDTVNQRMSAGTASPLPCGSRSTSMTFTNYARWRIRSARSPHRIARRSWPTGRAGRTSRRKPVAWCLGSTTRSRQSMKWIAP